MKFRKEYLCIRSFYNASIITKSIILEDKA